MAVVIVAMVCVVASLRSRGGVASRILVADVARGFALASSPLVLFSASAFTLALALPHVFLPGEGVRLLSLKE